MQCPNPISILRQKIDSNGNKVGEPASIGVPCGKCLICLEARREDWTFRVKNELHHAKSAYFVTLTYEDFALPVTEDGEITLSKRDVQLWMKQLRHKSKNQLRYYLVGEYGTKLERPHYHLILYNLERENLHEIGKTWEKGYVKIGTVTDASIHYVTGYIMFPETEDTTRQKPFSLMSRRPPLGHQYLKDNTELHAGNQQFHVSNNGFAQKMPRFYRRKIFSEENNEKYREQLEKRIHETEKIDKQKFPDYFAYKRECEQHRINHLKSKVKSKRQL